MSSDDSLFREVDEDVRREQLANIWQRYGNAIVAVSLGVIVAVAGLKGYEYWRLQQAEAAARSFFAAAKLESEGKTAEAAKAYAGLASGQDGYATLARFGEAATLADSGDTQGAVKAYDAVAASPTAPKELADAARVRAAWLLVETAAPAELETRLKGLNDPASAWRSAAREILGLAWYKAGDLAKADGLLNELLADPEAPQQARARAQLLISLIAPRLAKKAG